MCWDGFGGGGVCLFLGGGMVVALATEAAAQIPWDSDAWEVAAQQTRVETFQGREALFMLNGNAWLRDTTFQDGVIEFDIATTADQGFHGLRFRAVDRFNHEHVYLRPHLSGKTDAVQYNPIFNAVSGWQMYSDPRYALPVRIQANQWVHVRVAFQGRRMEMSVDGQVLVFPDLVREPTPGMVALNSYNTPTYFANVVVRPNADPDFSDDPGAPVVEAEPGTVQRWRVSEPFAESLVDGTVRLAGSVTSDRSWVEMPATVRGIVNIAQARPLSAEANTVFAAVTLRSDVARTVWVRIGFSDRVRAFLNGRQLFAGGDEYATRDYRFLGTMGLFDELFLPLEAGDNELWLAVSEDFGGWGVSMQVPDGQGVVVR